MIAHVVAGGSVASAAVPKQLITFLIVVPLSVG